MAKLGVALDVEFLRFGGHTYARSAAFVPFLFAVHSLDRAQVFWERPTTRGGLSTSVWTMDRDEVLRLSDVLPCGHAIAPHLARRLGGVAVDPFTIPNVRKFSAEIDALASADDGRRKNAEVEMAHVVEAYRSRKTGSVTLVDLLHSVGAVGVEGLCGTSVKELLRECYEISHTTLRDVEIRGRSCGATLDVPDGPPLPLPHHAATAATLREFAKGLSEAWREMSDGLNASFVCYGSMDMQAVRDTVALATEHPNALRSPFEVTMVDLTQSSKFRASALMGAGGRVPKLIDAVHRLAPVAPSVENFLAGSPLDAHNPVWDARALAHLAQFILS